MSALTASLVGRERELSDLEGELGPVLDGAFRCVLVHSEPGVGKTRLGQELIARQAGSARGMWARAHPLGATAPFGVWAEALERHLRERALEEIRVLCDGLGDLAGLLRSVALSRSVTGDPATPASGPRLLDSLGSLIAKLAAEQPLIVVLDDIHLADPSTWDMLHYLAAHPAGRRVLVVAMARTGELAGRPLAMRVLLDIEQQGALHRMALGPLSDDAVAQLAREVVDLDLGADVCEAVARRSRGNAFFAIGLLQALARADAGEGRRAVEALPEAVAEGVRARVADLHERAREVLDLLAVAGHRLELGEIAHITGRGLAELAPTLERLVGARLLAEEQVRSRWGYEVAHPLIEETLARDVGGARRLVIHREVGRALLARGHLAEAAPHFAHSAQAGDDEAIEVLREALAEADVHGAHREGVALLGTLGELLPAGDERWLAVAAALPAWMFDHRADNDTGTAAAALLKIDGHPADRLDQRTRAAVKGRLVTLLAYGTGDLRRARQAADDAIALHETVGDEPGALRVRLERAYVAALAGDAGALVEGAREVLARAEATADEALIESALGGLSSGSFTLGDLDTAESAVRRALGVARDRGEPYRVMRHSMNLGWILGHAGDLDEAYAAFEDTKATGPGWRQTIVPVLEAHVRWLAGDLDGALGCAEEAILLGVSLRRGMASVVAALASVESNPAMEARAMLEQARAVYGGRRDWYFITDQFRHAEALLAWREGRQDAAMQGLRTAARNLSTIGAPLLAVPVLVDVGELAAARGDARTGAFAATELSRVADASGLPLYRALAALGEAYAAIARGHPVRSVAPAEQAVVLLRSSGYRSFHARASAALGLAQRDAAAQEATRCLQEAATEFDAIGAVWRRDTVLDHLRAMGGSGRRAAAAARGADALTRREWEVARLGAQRLTAQEIATLLVVSRRTVESHLASAYSKLGVHSRGELIRTLAERDA